MPARKNKFSDLNMTERLMVLAELIKDPAIKRKAEAIAKGILEGDVDEEKVYNKVSITLSSLNFDEEVADHSGRTRDGYVDIYEKTDEVFYEALDPFTNELERYRKLNLPKQATAYCCGLIRGIMELNDDFVEYSPDSQRDAIETIIDKVSSWLPEECVRTIQACHDELFD